MNETKLETPGLDALLKRLAESNHEGWREAVTELVMLKNQCRNDWKVAQDKCAEAHAQYSKLWAKAYRFAEEAGLPLQRDDD